MGCSHTKKRERKDTKQKRESKQESNNDFKTKKKNRQPN